MKGLRILIDIIAFGSLWGALEVTLGGALGNSPRHGAVMANIGLLIMATRSYFTNSQGCSSGLA